MKKQMFKTPLFLALLFFSTARLLYAFQAAPDKSACNAEKIEGVYVFIHCKPVAQYDFVGTVKITGMVSVNSLDHMMNLCIKQARKDYPTADAIIVTGANCEKADAVKFK